MPFSVRGTGKALLLIAIIITGGCTYTVRPGNVPLAGTNQAITFPGASVLIKNAEQNAAETNIASEGRSSSGLKANRQAWTQKLVEALAGELARRGVQVRSKASLVLSLSMPGIAIHDDRSGSLMAIKVQVISSAGWSKTYETGAKTEGITGTGAADRLATESLAEVVRAMLGDAEFQAQLLKR